MKLRMSRKKIDLNSTDDQKKKIIEIYALKTCKLWDYYTEIITEINTLHDDNKLDDKDYHNRIIRIAEETRKMLAVLCIEQFYNTGDEALFDRSLEMDEEISLSLVSHINMNELDITEEQDRAMTQQVVIFYQAMFLNLDNISEPAFQEKSKEILVRDIDVVNMINKKLNRARNILKVDEVTLGKKYYEGLCMRSHYS